MEYKQLFPFYVILSKWKKISQNSRDYRIREIIELKGSGKKKKDKIQNKCSSLIISICISCLLKSPPLIFYKQTYSIIQGPLKYIYNIVTEFSKTDS